MAELVWESDEEPPELKTLYVDADPSRMTLGEITVVEDYIGCSYMEWREKSTIGKFLTALAFCKLRRLNPKADIDNIWDATKTFNVQFGEPKDVTPTNEGASTRKSPSAVTSKASVSETSAA